MSERRPRIVFMGTPEFAVASLSALKDAGVEIAAVVTAPDKPAGRGKQLQQPAVKEFARTFLDCPILQPPKLKDPGFISALEAAGADIFVVVAFRMLPAGVWTIPPSGTINLHASLLPQFRGAAPINHAIMNGETQSGVTTFLIDEQIDTGRILMQKAAEISPQDTAGSLYDKLKVLGADLLVETVIRRMNDSLVPLDQGSFNIPEEELQTAPKLFKEDCRIDWNSGSQQIYNFIRGLSPYPCAYASLSEPGITETQIRIFSAGMLEKTSADRPGTITSDLKSFIHVSTEDRDIEILELQAPGKKKMNVKAFLQGNRLDLNELFFT